jgi:hypothetical protein
MVLKCTEPGRVTADQLFAVATGEQAEPARSHVEQCSVCAADVASYEREDRALRTRLLRNSCPSSLALGELVLGMLETTEALAIRAHLVDCRFCTEEMRHLGADLAGDPMADPVPEPGPLRRFLARLLPTPALGLAPAGLRGGTPAEGHSYQAEGITVSLSVQAEGQGVARSWTLLGLVDVDGSPPDATCDVRVIANGVVMTSVAVDEYGSFLAPGLAAGIYDLELRCVDKVLAIEGVGVGGDE